MITLLLAPALAGCVSDNPESDDAARDVIRVTPGGVPGGAAIETADELVAFVWDDVPLPFDEDVVIPEGTAIARLITSGPADAAVRSYMADADTGRRRCNADSLEAWNVGHLGRHVCSGTALVDPPGTTWTVQASGPAGVAADVRLEFLPGPLDGIAGLLDVTQLSMPTYEVKTTTGQYVESFDGTQLWTEVTLPEGDGPWPTVMAASPYNGQTGRIDGPEGTPAMWSYFTHDWARRGYAIVNVDVRGFGLSDGCVEIWGQNEQQDQAFMVDWVAKQPWSDGRVGFYGQSYVGTTPVAAAVQAPEALKAIIAVAPVINAYEDWHYGGVPNGENAGSPAAYQVLTDPPGQGTTPPEIIENSVKGVCDPTIVVRANDPRSVYDAFYEERNFKLRAADVKAAVLYTQGFEDSNVKSAMIPGWFNELQGPKLGLFGHWVHQHPTRADEEIMFLGWMDQYVKGRALGFEELPEVEIATNVGTVRNAAAWPEPEAASLELWPDYAGGELSTSKPSSTTPVQIIVLPAGDAEAALDTVPAGFAEARQIVRVTYAVEEPIALSGVPILNVRGTLNSQGNAYLAAELYDISADGAQLVSYGMYNLAHENGHDSYEPVAGRPSDVDLPFLPTEWVFEPGHRLVIDVRAVQAGPDGLTLPGPPGVFTLGEHPDGNGPFGFSTIPLADYDPMPISASP